MYNNCHNALVKREPQDEPVRRDVIQYVSRPPMRNLHYHPYNPPPPPPAQGLVPVYPFHLHPNEMYGQHPQFIVTARFPPAQRLYPHLSPPTATIATTYGNVSLSPTETASIQRPFKALTSPKTNPLPLLATFDPSTEAAYQEFKSQLLAKVPASVQTSRNRNMSRIVPANPEKMNDPDYVEKRRKNNEAAKKSRDARKFKEDEMAIRVAFLEREVYRLLYKLVMVQRQKRAKLAARNAAIMPFRPV